MALSKEIICKLCSREGIFIGPRVVGDLLHCNIMIVGQNPANFISVDSSYRTQIEKLPCIAMQELDASFTCNLINKCIEGFTNIYITNIVKCASNVFINDDILATCSSLIFAGELEFVSPDVVICLGRMAYGAVSSIKLALDKKFEIFKFYHPGYFKRKNLDINSKSCIEYISNFKKILDKFGYKDYF